MSTGPFRVTGDTVVLALRPAERGAMRSVPTLLDIGGDAGGRLDYTAHPEDPDADARYRSLVGDDLAVLRAVDRAAFERFISGEPTDFEGLEAFMRVVGEARLVLAARLGIEEDGWEAEANLGADPELALLAWLGYLQDAAVEVLSQ